VTPPRLDHESELSRALGYPYPLTHQSFVYRSATPDAVQLIGAADPFPDVAGRTPVLAVGSNQSPQQLARKFRGSEWGDIPTARVHLQDFDTVYSAHVTGYGSIAATLHPSPGTRVALYVNWLSPAQLEAMHATELTSENYTFGRLDGVQLTVEAGPELASVHFYQGRRGAFVPDGDIIPLAEVPASGRRFSAKTQLEILTRVRDHLAGELALEAFIQRAIEQPEERQAFISRLAVTSQMFASDHYIDDTPRSVPPRGNSS